MLGRVRSETWQVRAKNARVRAETWRVRAKTPRVRAKAAKHPGKLMATFFFMEVGIGIFEVTLP
ncbi:hypothetical protein B4U37_01280 [Sutcliffiella horikoshii]|uniref:Uncharacterized protein n=1 Tax=Sutcliffiella horikoshii TaxID=79883 RepID=A0ABN4Z9F0_9BACI|nr:hypothetical protein [Sutcliffiella horikoshii]ART74776.1 hypothetical protein B4U37_01280 [Sutcliffiella horikoshii]